MIFYTAVGNRRQPPAVLALCREVGRELALRGLILRTGDDLGCAAAFLSGHAEGARGQHPVAPLAEVGPRLWLDQMQANLTADPEIYCPEDEIPLWAFASASRLIPASLWLKATDRKRRLAARDAMMVLGRDGTSPSRFILTHAFPETTLTTKVADQAGIPRLNIRGLTLADALAFAHQHAGVLVLRPGDVLPARLVPEGCAGFSGNDFVFVYLRNSMNELEWFKARRGGYFEVQYDGRFPLGNLTLFAFGLTQKTATADNLRRLVQEYEEHIHA